MHPDRRLTRGQLSRYLRCRCRNRMVVVVVVGMMSENASVVVGPGVAVVIMVVMSRRGGVDVEEVAGAEEVGM